MFLYLWGKGISQTDEFSIGFTYFEKNEHFVKYVKIWGTQKYCQLNMGNQYILLNITS